VSIAQSLLPEFDEEMKHTRRALERVPEERFPWKPHDKSMTLGRLATLVAELPGWATNACERDELDLAPPGAPPPRWEALPTLAAVLAKFDENAAQARAAISRMTDADFGKPWTLKMGGRALVTMPKLAVYRSSVMNHLIHHRGQLTVFLRLVGAPVPAIYGPSADERGM
jgi:uncharacterized damage-inducible protein DinB